MPPKSTKSNYQNEPSTSKSNLTQTCSDDAWQPSGSNKTQVSEEAMEEYVKKCVRYFIYKAGANLPIRKPDLCKNVLACPPRMVESIIKKADKVLDKIYGLTITPHDQSANLRTYLVSNKLPYRADIHKEKFITIENEEDDSQEKIPKDIGKALTLLILSHIFMSGNESSEAALISFLESLNIELKGHDKYFGKINEHIQNLIKQKYLESSVEENTKKITYSWGAKAECEVSKLEILKFVSSVYGDNPPETWTTQFEDANNQNLSVNVNVEGNGDVVEINED